MPILDLPGNYGSTVRPPRDSNGRKPWAKNPSSPDADDGTRIDATFVNDLIGMIRTLIQVAGVAASPGDDNAIANAVVALIGATAPATHSHSLDSLLDGSCYVRMTVAERAKLASLATNFKGAFSNIAALEAAYPEAEIGDWAILTLPGEPASVAVWDGDAEPPGWVDIDNAPPQTAAQVPFTPGGGIEANNVQAALEELDQKKEDASKKGEANGYAPLDNNGKVPAAHIRRVGEFFWYFASSPPDYALLCDGSEVSRTVYADLWAFAQTSGNLAASEETKEAGQFGPGDGATTFTLPDLVTGSEFIRAVTTGRNIGTWQDEAFKQHNHGLNIDLLIGRRTSSGYDQGLPAGGAAYNKVGTLEDSTPEVNDTNSAGGSETRPRNVALLPCIVY